jgi:truncated hemoglobin YjbI
MLAAVDEVATSEDVRAEIAEYMVRAAEHMVNVEG